MKEHSGQSECKGPESRNNLGVTKTERRGVGLELVSGAENRDRSEQEVAGKMAGALLVVVKSLSFILRAVGRC